MRTPRRARTHRATPPPPRASGTLAPARAQVDADGPVFVAYTSRGDGARWARDVAATLRAWGLPVWHAECDLRPGNIEARIREALADRPSGAVLVVTPEIDASGFLREVELPALHRLAAAGEFGCLVIDTRDEASAHGAAPPAGPPTGRRTGWTLAHALATWQTRRVTSRDDLGVAAEDLVRHRLRLFSTTKPAELPIRFRTRESAQMDRAPGLLVCYGESPGGHRRPPHDMWAPYRTFLARLKSLVATAGVDAVRVRGRAHLTAAFALGAALPTVSGVRLRVEDTEGRLWEGEADIAVDEHHERWGAPSAPVAVFVDMLQAAPFATFDRHLALHKDLFGASLKLVTPLPRPAPAPLTPEQGATLARQVSQRIRGFAGDAPVHLFLAVPFPMAVLLGTLSNMLDVHLYELETQPAAHYAPTVRCQAGVGGGPIVEILDSAQ